MEVESLTIHEQEFANGKCPAIAGHFLSCARQRWIQKP